MTICACFGWYGAPTNVFNGALDILSACTSYSQGSNFGPKRSEHFYMTLLRKVLNSEYFSETTHFFFCRDRNNTLKIIQMEWHCLWLNLNQYKMKLWKMCIPKVRFAITTRAPFSFAP